MALGTPAICMTPDNSVRSTSVTYTLTTTSGNAVFVCAGCENSSADPNQMAISDTAGWTWTLVRDETYATGTSPRLRVQVWQATSNGSSNDVTVTGSGAAAIGFEAFQISGSNVAVRAENNWKAENAAGDPSGSFPNAFQSGGAAFAFVLAAQNNNLTNGGTGLTLLGSQQPYSNNSGRFGLWYDTSSPSQGAHSWTSTNLYTIAVGFELYEAAGGATHDGAGVIDGAATVSLAGITLKNGAGVIDAAASVSALAVLVKLGQMVVNAASGMTLSVGVTYHDGAGVIDGASSLTIVGQVVKLGSAAIDASSLMSAVAALRLSGGGVIDAEALMELTVFGYVDGAGVVDATSVMTMDGRTLYLAVDAAGDVWVAASASGNPWASEDTPTPPAWAEI